MDGLDERTRLMRQLLQDWQVAFDAASGYPAEPSDAVQRLLRRQLDQVRQRRAKAVLHLLRRARRQVPLI